MAIVQKMWTFSDYGTFQVVHSYVTELGKGLRGAFAANILFPKRTEEEKVNKFVRWSSDMSVPSFTFS